MQKGVFTTWIKELCALVFVQTIQAFILAIVLSIILTFIFPDVKDKEAIISSQNSVSALGVLCIILLTSLTKMEQITKKIFGLDSSLLQNKPPHGLMASWMALKAAGRVLNNVPKMVGGVGNIIGAGTDKKKAEATKYARLNKRGLDLKGNPLPQPAGSNNNSNPESQQDDNLIQQARENANSQFASNVGGGSVGGATGATPSSRPTDKDMDAYDKIMDKYNDELAKAKEKRRKGIESALAGAAETVGAGFGGMAGLSIGAVSGLATGDLDQIPKAMAYGIGVGDAAGENLTKAITTTTNSIRSRAKANSQLDKQLAQMETNLKINEQHRGSQAKRVKRINEKLDKNFNNRLQ